MIRREESDSIWIIHQMAHTYISGRIAEHWIGDGAMVCTPREEMLLAAYTHDAGWAASEQAPRINAQGFPRTFTEMDLDEHFVIWQDSIDSVYMQNRYAGLITSMHCTALYEQRLRYLSDAPSDRERVQDFLDSQRAWEQALITSLREHPRYALAVESACLNNNLRLLQVWDYLSLLLCMSTVHEQVLEDVPLSEHRRDVLYVSAGGPRSMVLDPFPLSQPLTIWIDARQVIGGPFESDEEFQKALVDVPYKPLVFEVGPA